MRCLDEERGRWYCYPDDQIFYVNENRWGEPPPTPPPPHIMNGRKPTREDIIRHRIGHNILWTICCFTLIVAILSNITFQTFWLGWFVYFGIGNLYYAIEGNRRKHDPIDWQSVSVKPFRKPRDRQLMLLWLWTYISVVVAAIGIGLILSHTPGF